MECLSRLSLVGFCMFPMSDTKKKRIPFSSSDGLETSYLLSKGEAALRSEGSGQGLGDSHSPCLQSPGGRAVALAGKEQRVSLRSPSGVL